MNPDSSSISYGWKRWKKKKRKEKTEGKYEPWYPQARDVAEAPKNGVDPWDGSTGDGDDLWSVYRAPLGAIRMVGEALATR